MYLRYTRMLEGCGKVVKYALFVANFIIMVGGVVVFAVGIWTLADRSFMERLLGTDLYVSSASILIATGVVVTIISFLGCLGAFKEIKCMLLTFFIILFMIFITMLVGGILGYVFRNEVDDRMYQEMIMSIPSYKNDSVVTDAWDAVQQHFQCCGVTIPPRTEPYRVWSLKNSHFNQNHQVPESCCMKKEWLHACLKNPTDRDTYMDSCHEKVRDFVKGHAVIVGGIGIGISCLLVVGMVLSCAMFLMIR